MQGLVGHNVNSYRLYIYIMSCQHKKNHTINSDHAVTVSVTSLEESLGLGLSQCACTGGEGLKEKPRAKQTIILVTSESLSLSLFPPSVFLCL